MNSYEQKLLYYHYLKQFHPLGQDAIDNPWLLDLWMRDEIGPRMKPPEKTREPKENVMEVRELHKDHVLDESDNGCMLYFINDSNLQIEPDSCPVGFVCHVICKGDCGMVVAGREITVNRRAGAMRYFGSGVNILAQPELDNWTLGNAQAG